MSKLQDEVDAVGEAFLAGDRGAWGTVYGLAHGVLAARARKKGAGEDAEDLASDAILYVQGRGARNWTGGSVMALLNKAVDWRVMSFLRDKRGKDTTLQCDLPLMLKEDDLGEQMLVPMDLETLETWRIMHGVDQHPYLTTITTENPESIALSENLREKLERMGRAACGDAAWETFAKVTLGGKSQAEVAEEENTSQQRVSQICKDVARGIRSSLLGS